MLRPMINKIYLQLYIQLKGYKYIFIFASCTLQVIFITSIMYLSLK